MKSEQRCAGIACHIGKTTGYGCPGEACGLEQLADRGVVRLPWRNDEQEKEFPEGVCGTAREAPTGSLLGDPSSSSAGTPPSEGAGGPVPSAPIDRRVGITRNYPTTMPLGDAIAAHRAFIGNRALDQRFELDTLNLDNGFVAITGYYLPGPDEARDLNELFGMIA